MKTNTKKDLKKIILSYIFIMIILFTFGAYIQVRGEQLQSHIKINELKFPNSYSTFAQESFAIMQKYYLLPNWMYKEDLKSNTWYASAWYEGAVLEAIAALNSLYPNNLTYVNDFEKAFSALVKHYWNSSGIAAFSATVGGSIFYDDNEWIALALMSEYNITGNVSYLIWAEKIFNFIITGWSNTFGGGIYWELGGDTKNTVSNAPAAVLALELYSVTKNQSYLIWALKIYNWTYTMLNVGNGLYFDHINSDGSINAALFTYNTGMMIQAGILIYEETHNDTYLDEAIASAKAAQSYFVNAGFYPASPWFNVKLLKADLMLYQINHSFFPLILVWIHDLDSAWLNRNPLNGLFGSAYQYPASLSPEWNGEYYPLIDIAAMISSYAFIARVVNTTEIYSLKIVANSSEIISYGKPDIPIEYSVNGRVIYAQLNSLGYYLIQIPKGNFSIVLASAGNFYYIMPRINQQTNYVPILIVGLTTTVIILSIIIIITKRRNE